MILKTAAFYSGGFFITFFAADKTRQNFYNIFMETALSFWQTLLLSALVAVVLFVPFLVHKAEENLEVFLFICSLAAVSISGVWSGHLLAEAVKEPLLISVAVLVLGLLFKRFGGGLNLFANRMENRLGPKLFLFSFILLLGLLSSFITAIIAALLAAEVIKSFRLNEREKTRLIVYACFAIGLGAVLTPVGEPLSTIVVARLKEAPYYADFFFLLTLLGWWIVPGVTLFALLSVPLASRALTDPNRSVSADTNAAVLGRAGKVYLFVAALVLLGEGLKPLAEKTILHLSRGVLYWINSLSAVLDNATLASIEIQPSLPPDTLVFLLLSLVLAGGLLIPGNIPNIICASKLDIKSRDWARVALPVGLVCMLIYFILLIVLL